MATAEFVSGVLAERFDLFSVVPDSRSEPLLRALRARVPGRVVQLSDEAAAVSLASGATVTCTAAAVFMESSGLRRAFEVLGRLSGSHGIHPALFVTDRGVIGDWQWWASCHYPHARVVANAIDARAVELTADSSDSRVEETIDNVLKQYKAQQSPIVVWVHPGFVEAL